MIGRRAALFCVAAAIWAAPVLASSENLADAQKSLGPPGGAISAEAAHRAAENGEITLLDIRTPGEWKATGAPKGAVRLNLYSKEFGAKLTAMLQDPAQRPIAVLCATGRRSGYVMQQLRRLGLDKRVYNVAEGMKGSKAGPGWIARGLPVDRSF